MSIIRVPIIDHCAASFRPAPHEPELGNYLSSTQPESTNPPLLLQLHQKISTPHSSLSIPPCISLFPSPHLSSPLFAYLTPSHYSLSSLSSSLSFPLTPCPFPLSRSLPLCKFLTYTHPVPPSLPRSIEIGKTGSSGPYRNGRYHGMASSRHGLGSAGLGRG